MTAYAMPEYVSSSIETSLAKSMPPGALDKADARPTAALDLQQLLVHCMQDSSFAMSLLDEFASTVDSRIDQFTSSCEQGQVDAVRDAAHALRGVAGILGAATLQEISTELEHASSASECQLAELVESISTELRRVKAEIAICCTAGQSPI